MAPHTKAGDSSVLPNSSSSSSSGGGSNGNTADFVENDSPKKPFIVELKSIRALSAEAGTIIAKRAYDKLIHEFGEGDSMEPYEPWLAGLEERDPTWTGHLILVIGSDPNGATDEELASDPPLTCDRAVAMCANDPHNVRIGGLITSKYLPKSRTGTIPYVLLDRDYRGKGVSRRLVNSAVSGLQRDGGDGGIVHVYLETYTRPSEEGGDIATIHRRWNALAHLGFHRITKFRYVQPPYTADLDVVHEFCLCIYYSYLEGRHMHAHLHAHTCQACDTYTYRVADPEYLPASQLREFLDEHWEGSLRSKPGWQEHPNYKRSVADVFEKLEPEHKFRVMDFEKYFAKTQKFLIH